MSELRNTVEPKTARLTGQRTEFLEQKVGTQNIGRPRQESGAGKTCRAESLPNELSEFDSALNRGQNLKCSLAG